MMKLTATGKDNKPVAGAVANTFAVFDAGVDGTDYSAFLYPKAHLDKVSLHSALDYIGRVATITTSYNFPAGSYTFGSRQTLNLGAHGQEGFPLYIAELSLDNVNWYVMNGTMATAFGPALTGRFFSLQFDDTYLYASGLVGGTIPAQTVYFRVHILARTFGEPRPNNGKAFLCTPTSIQAAGGVFDTDRDYLQAAGEGDTPMIYSSGRTVGLNVTTTPNAYAIGFGNSGNNFNAPLTNAISVSWPPYIAQGARKALTFGTPGIGSPRARLEPGRVTLSNGAGNVVFDSARKMVAFVDEFQDSVSIPSRAAVGSDVIHQVVHYSRPVAATTDIIIGSCKFTTASMFVPDAMNNDFSGGHFATGWWSSGGGYVWLRAFSIIYPRINGSNIEIVEEYYNNSMSGSGNQALSAYTFDFHIFACATTGGF